MLMLETPPSSSDEEEDEGDVDEKSASTGESAKIEPIQKMNPSYFNNLSTFKPH